MPGRTARTSRGCRFRPKLVANLITAAGANRVLTMDLQGADRVLRYPGRPSVRRADHHRVSAAAELRADYDRVAGRRRQRARAYAKRLGAELAIIKRREDGTAEVMNVVGDADRVCVIADDIIDTAGTIHKAAQALRRMAPAACWRARYLACCRGRRQRIEQAPIDRLIVTNSIRPPGPRPDVTRSSCCRWRASRGRSSIHEETSVSKLFV
jgi:ribose-phosphate pyrophosphokinase